VTEFRAGLILPYQQENSLTRVGRIRLQQQRDQCLGAGCRLRTFSLLAKEPIVQSIDLARLIGRDILQLQGSQLILGWLVIATIANRPWSLVK
jgi:hypothetical protein